MIHGIYLKNRPKGKWHLISVAQSVESAIHDQKIALDQSIKEGNLSPEVAIKTFDSTLSHIPEFLTEIKNKTPLYN